MLWHPCEFDPRVKPERGTCLLDRDHPLADGVFGFWPLDEGAGALCLDAAGMCDAGALTGSWCPSGIALTRASNHGLKVSRSRAVTQWSVSARVRFASAPSSGNTYVFVGRFTTTPFHHNFWFQLQSNKLTLGMYNGSFVSSSGTFTGWTAGQSYTVGATYAAGQARLYINGVPDALSTGTITGTPTNDGTTYQLGVGYDPTGSTSGFDGVVEAAGYTAAAWTAERHAQFHAKPYAMFRPVVRRAYSIPAGGGGATSYFRRTAFIRAGSRGVWN